MRKKQQILSRAFIFREITIQFKVYFLSVHHAHSSSRAHSSHAPPNVAGGPLQVSQGSLQALLRPPCSSKTSMSPHSSSFDIIGEQFQLYSDPIRTEGSYLASYCTEAQEQIHHVELDRRDQEGGNPDHQGLEGHQDPWASQPPVEQGPGK